MPAAKPETRAEALRLLGEGCSRAEVGRRLGVTAATVSQWARAAGHESGEESSPPLGTVEALESIVRWSVRQSTPGHRVRVIRDVAETALREVYRRSGRPGPG